MCRYFLKKQQQNIFNGMITVMTIGAFFLKLYLFSSIINSGGRDTTRTA